MDSPTRYQNIWVTTIGKTAIGPISVAVSTEGLVGVSFGEQMQMVDWGKRNGAYNPLLDQAVSEIEEYLAGRRKIFSIPIDWRGLGGFQMLALQKTAAIPYGTIRTYKDMAAEIGHPGASRAFGGAMARNPMPLVVPCHRVVGSDRKLHGFGAPGGISVKASLLEMEGVPMDGQRVR